MNCLRLRNNYYMKLIITRNARFFGGAEKYILSLTEGLRGKNIDIVEVWTNEKKLFGRLGQFLKLKSRRRYLGPIIDSKISFALFIIIYPFLASYYLVILLFYKSVKKVTTLHLNSLSEFLLFTGIGKVLNLKIIWTVDVAFCAKNNYLLKRLFLSASRKADKIIAVSEFMRSNLVKSGVAVDKINLVYNGVKANSSLPPSQKPDYPIKIGFIGKVAEEKGIFVFFESVAEILRAIPRENVEFWVVGKAISGLSVPETARKNIIFKGWQEDLFSIYNELDIVVVPSLVEESFGLVAVEAMLVEKAVVVSDRGALPELVEHDTSGIIVPAGDGKALGLELIRLINNPSKIQYLGENSYLRAKNLFSLEQMVENTIKTIYG